MTKIQTFINSSIRIGTQGSSVLAKKLHSKMYYFLITKLTALDAIFINKKNNESSTYLIFSHKIQPCTYCDTDFSIIFTFNNNYQVYKQDRHLSILQCVSLHL